MLKKYMPKTMEKIEQAMDLAEDMRDSTRTNLVSFLNERMADFEENSHRPDLQEWLSSGEWLILPTKKEQMQFIDLFFSHLSCGCLLKSIPARRTLTTLEFASYLDDTTFVVYETVDLFAQVYEFQEQLYAKTLIELSMFMRDLHEIPGIHKNLKMDEFVSADIFHAVYKAIFSKLDGIPERKNDS